MVKWVDFNPYKQFLLPIQRLAQLCALFGVCVHRLPRRHQVHIADARDGTGSEPLTRWPDLVTECALNWELILTTVC